MYDEDGISNPSGNRLFQDVVTARQSRRQVLAGGLGFAASSFFASSAFAGKKALGGKKNSLMNFQPVPLQGGGALSPRISANYEYDVILPWGEAVAPGSQETIGIGHDGMWYFPLENPNNHGLLVLNHEYGSNSTVIGKSTPASLDEVRASQYAHGVSVVELMKVSGKWQTVNTGGYARRIHVNTPMTFGGPAANSELLANRAGNLPRGTLNNCANGYTPWGTYLTCEENFHGYFGTSRPFSRTPAEARYGLSANSSYGWFRFDDRFDLRHPDYENEANRFGWIVEIDPNRPDSVPVKRTALGRFKHEGIAIAEGRGGRIVGYMGDDQANDYIYKFVSEKNWKSMLARGMSPLDHGSLYVARFNEDGSGDWLELTIENPVLAKLFNDQAEILVYARQAADALGATKMDRPEWTTVDSNGIVYCTLTNNTGRSESHPANPMAPNRNGHIIRWLDEDNHVGIRFNWDIFVIAEHTKGTEDSFASPDGLWADPDGRLFIQTDGGQNDGLNNQMLVADTETGEISRLFEGVAGCEVTGITMTPDRRTLFCNLQHPSSRSEVPVDSTIVISRKDGGIVGS